MVVWNSGESAGDDSSASSIQGQRFDKICGQDSDADGVGDLCDPCPNDATDTCDTERSTSETVGSGGGTVTTPDDSVTLDIPPGALDDDFDLMNSGLFDSVAFMELITDIEDTLDIELDFDDLDPEEFTSLGGLVRCAAS